MIKVTRGTVQTTYMQSIRRSQVARRLEAAIAAREAAADEAAGNAAYTAAIEAALPAFTLDEVITGMQDVIRFMTPVHGLQRVKRYLRRYCRKPADMSVREYWANFARINDEEIPLMPPNFNNSQSLEADEVKDILLFALPKSWQSDMNKQNFDPFEGTVQELIEFAERMETAEALDGKKPSNHVSNKGNDKKRSSSSNYKDKSGQLYCLLHGKGNHGTDECNAMKSQAKKMKTSHSSNSNSNSNYKSKSWKSKDYDVKKRVKQELQVLLKKAAGSKRKDLNAFAALAEESDNNSKASNNSDDASMHSARSNISASSDGSMNMIQQMEAADLKDDEEFDLDNL
jgi:hypothetical protein